MKVLKSAWKLLVLIIIVAFGFLYYASSKVEEKYQDAITSMNNGDWNRAVSLILETPHYKEASDLYIYMYPHKLLYSQYTTEEDRIKGLNKAADFIKLESIKMKGANSPKFTGELKELEKVLNFKVRELNAKILDEPIRKSLDEGVDLIKKGSYQEALLKLQAVGNDSIYGTDKQELVKYVSLLTVIPSNDFESITNMIADLNPDYSGVLSNEIRQTVQAYVELANWSQLYGEKRETAQKDEDKAQETDKPQPPQNAVSVVKSVAVGMKREDVITILGSPASSNVIINKYGNYEEMAYSGNKYVYLENNIVTVVK